MDLFAARDLIARLSSSAPKEAAEVLLEYVRSDHAARIVALYAVDEDGQSIKLFGSHSLEQSALDWILGTWKKKRAQLKGGLAVQEVEHNLVPLIRDRMLVALLYIETLRVHDETVIDITPPLAAAVLRANSAASHTAIDDYLGSTPNDEIERRKLLLALGRYEWNIARVARHFSRSRTSIYRWLEQLNIPLERPART